MKENQEEQKKKKYAFWLPSEVKALVEKNYQTDNCTSQSEFVENAIRFYAGYVSAENANEYLAPILSQVIRGALDRFATHINRNIFRLSVEDAKTWIIISGLIGVSPDQLKDIHGRAINEVKRLDGKLTYTELYDDPIQLDYNTGFMDQLIDEHEDDEDSE